MADIKPPRKIRIAARTFEVKIVPKVAHPLVDSDGATMINELSITLPEWAAKGRKQEVLVHETLHAVLDQAGFVGDHPDAPPEISGDLEERICTRLAPLLLDLIQRNPQLITYLQS